MASIFTIFGEIAINADSANKTIGDTTSRAGALSKTFSKVGKTAMAVGKTIAKGAAVGAAAFGAIAKKSISAYADYEQLVGGVETLFGAGGLSIEEYAASVGKSVDKVEKKYASMMAAQDTVFANARNAYRTAGLSANEYMETATSFAASLISGLKGDTEEAARLTDMAVTDMADNANKMGTSIESIQNAYQGFAKQNYTMLDNLKIGYGGTQSEMKRLLKDAQKISGQKYNIKNLDDIIEAIHVIQTEMGITGTTAKEASETISGSWNSTKAAWENLMTGLADGNADVDQLFKHLTASSQNVLRNVGKVIPTITKNLLSTVGSMLQMAGSSIYSVWVNTVYPALQNKLKIKFGIELPPHDELIEKINNWWNNGKESAYEKIKSVFVWTLGNFENPGNEGFLKSVTDWWEGTGKPSVTSVTKWTFGELVVPAWSDFVKSVSDWWENTVNPWWKKIAKFEISDIELPSAEEIASKIKSWWDSILSLVGYYKKYDPFKEYSPEELQNTGYRWDEEKGQPVKITPAEGTEGELQSTLDGYNLEGKAELNASENSGSNLQSYIDGLDLVARIRLVCSGDIEGYSEVQPDGSHAGGLDRVPFDGYRAVLHKDEMVLKASEAAVYRGDRARASGYRRAGSDQAGNGQVVNVTQNIQSVPMSPSELAAQTKYALGLLRFSV